MFSVYLGDPKMAGPTESFKARWDLLRTKIRFDEPTPLANNLVGDTIKAMCRSRFAEEDGFVDSMANSLSGAGLSVGLEGHARPEMRRGKARR